METRVVVPERNLVHQSADGRFCVFEEPLGRGLVRRIAFRWIDPETGEAYWYDARHNQVALRAYATSLARELAPHDSPYAQWGLTLDGGVRVRKGPFAGQYEFLVPDGFTADGKIAYRPVEETRCAHAERWQQVVQVMAAECAWRQATNEEKSA